MCVMPDSFLAATADCYDCYISAGAPTAHPCCVSWCPRVCRYPTFTSLDERLEPSSMYLTFNRWYTLARIWAVSQALSALGKSREARMLSNAYKAMGVYNSRRYDRSITCAVDNARALQEQLTREDRQLLPLVWEESLMSWEAYSNVSLPGIRKLLLHTKAESAVIFPDHTAPKFRTWPAADPSVLRLSAPAGDAEADALMTLANGADGVDAVAFSKRDQKRQEGVVNLTAKAM